jgi:hypothetical protein
VDDSRAEDWSLKGSPLWALPARLNSLLAWRQFGSDTSLTSRQSSECLPVQDESAGSSSGSRLTSPFQQQKSANDIGPLEQTNSRHLPCDSSDLLHESPREKNNNLVLGQQHPLASLFGGAISRQIPTGAAAFISSSDLTSTGLSMNGRQEASESLMEIPSRFVTANRASSNPRSKQELLLHQPKSLSSDLSSMRQFRQSLSRPPFTYVALIRQVGIIVNAGPKVERGKVQEFCCGRLGAKLCKGGEFPKSTKRNVVFDGPQNLAEFCHFIIRICCKREKHCKRCTFNIHKLYFPIY